MICWNYLCWRNHVGACLNKQSHLNSLTHLFESQPEREHTWHRKYQRCATEPVLRPAVNGNATTSQHLHQLINHHFFLAFATILSELCIHVWTGTFFCTLTRFSCCYHANYQLHWIHIVVFGFTYHSHNPAPFRIHEIRYMENFHLTLWPMHFGTDLCTHYESFAIHLTDKTDWTRWRMFHE